MKLKQLLTKTFLVVACLGAGTSTGWADVLPTYTWDFTSDIWDGKTFATGSAVSFTPSAVTPTGTDKYVTFTFETDGAAYMQNNASSSVYGKYFWYKVNGSATTNNVSLVIPAGYKATFDLGLGSNNRPFNYVYSVSAITQSCAASSLVYENGSESDKTITIWATNTNRDGKYQNGIKSITLSPVTSYNWDFTKSAIWNSVTNTTADNNYASDGSTATTGHFVNLKGNVVYKSNGIGFGAVGSTSDNHAKIAVPKGYKASVTCRVTSNRNISSSYNGDIYTFSANYNYTTKEYDNTAGASDVDLYLYGSANVTGHNDYPSITNIFLQQYFKMTTNYIYNDGASDNVIKTAVVEYVPLGSEYTFPYDSKIYDTENAKTYNYSSGAETINYVSEDVEKTIYYTQAASVSYTVNVTAKYGSNSVKIADGISVVEGNTYTYYYPAYYLDGTTLYAAPADDGDSNDADGLSFGGIVTVTGNTDIVLNYVAEEGECAFYAEGVTIDNSYSANPTTPSKSSNGSSHCISNKAGLLTDMDLSNGVYSIEIAFGQRKTYSVSPNVTTTLDNGSSTNQTLGSVSVSNGGYTKQTFNNILIVEGEEIYIASDNFSNNSGVSKWALDYIVVRKLHDVTDPTKILGKVDYTTGYGSVWNDNPTTFTTGETAYYKFKNYNSGSGDAWNNWNVWVATTGSVNKTILRADAVKNMGGETGTFVSNPTSNTFVADLNGATVELYSSLADAGDGTYTLTVKAVTTKADGTKMSPDYVYTETGYTDTNLKVHLSVDLSWLEILEQKTYPTSVSVPVGNSGFATYANHNYALDFSDVSGLTAYTATVSGNEVTFTPVTQVPAGTGLLLKGATASVPVIANAKTIVNNALYAPTANVAGLNYDQDDYYNYILTQPAGKSVGFYRANNNNVAAGKAYLRVSKNSSARQFSFIGLDGESEASGINAVNSNQISCEFYDLQGRRTSQPTKGLYIVNGKKVIIK